jgi:transcriptional regulator with XRE-family HTH domain
LGDEILTVDLFGDLTTLPSGRRGRPAHRWSQNSANRVILALAMGYSDAEIAEGLGVSAPTLRKYYFSELKRRKMQRTRFELWRAETLAALAGAGNVTALKELGKVMEKRDRHLAEQRLRQSDDRSKMGKKEARIEAARTALESDDLLTPGYGPN